MSKLIDTFKTCTVSEGPMNPGSTQVSALTYFHPLKDGTWRYYNTAGKLIREETWSAGIFLETHPAEKK